MIRRIVTGPLIRLLAGKLPAISATEQAALEAGTVGWEAELFRGNPNWARFLSQRDVELSTEETEFLEGPVDELCARLDQWEISQAGDLSRGVWDFIKTNRFFGIIIPKEYGGLGFSAAAHSAIVTKIASRSIPAAVTVMVPNSLGPAELLLAYGTQEQKDKYLNRLAIGAEIPCFALTEPEAGSDAASIQSNGVVCRADYQGREIVGIRLNWNKRYTTLGPVATLIGLAFRLRDPQRLLGETVEIGITCALVPADLPGIRIGDRHDPMGVAFLNGPSTGTGVFIPVDWIIGGPKMAGKGWTMLMERLAIGRAISLPALSVGGAELMTRATGAFATVREQFGRPIGDFEGIQELLWRIGGLTYLMNAGRLLAVAAIVHGERPSIVSAIVKAYLTENMRGVVNDAMDIFAGAGISRGPHNTLAEAYLAIPIGITVEGANILTRSLIIFGQGLMRCHPYLRAETVAIAAQDINHFEKALGGHFVYAFRNGLRAFYLSLTGARWVSVPEPLLMKRYFQRLTRVTAALSIASEIMIAGLGGKLKRSEIISGRFADVLAWSYLASAALKRFVDDGQNPVDLPVASWACEYAIWRAESALKSILDNAPSRWMGWLLKLVIFGLKSRFPADVLGAEVAGSLLEDREGRRRLTRDIYIPEPKTAGMGRLEAALGLVVAAREPESKLKRARKRAHQDISPHEVLSAVELDLLREAERARKQVLEVDAFESARKAA